MEKLINLQFFKKYLTVLEPEGAFATDPIATAAQNGSNVLKIRPQIHNKHSQLVKTT